MGERPTTARTSGRSIGLLLLVALALMAAALALAAPSRAQTDPPADGDWVVADATTVEGRDLAINGNVSVGPTGRLTLIDVVLRLNCSFPGEFNITVEAGGELTLRDTDHDPATTADATVVTSVWGAHYLWFNRAGSKLRISACEVRDCGVPVAYRRGMMVETSDAVIENSTFTHCNYGIYVLSSSPVIEDCVVEANDGYGLYVYRGAARVERCTFRDNFDAGAWIVAAQGLLLRDCTFADHEWAGLNASASNLFIEGCTFRNNTWYGARFYLNCRGSLANCTVTGGSYCGVYLGENCNLALADDVVTGVSGRGLWLYRSNATVERLTARGCNEGAFIYGSEPRLIGCAFEGSRFNGVTVSDSRTPELEGCSVTDNGNNGVYVGSLWSGLSRVDLIDCDISRNGRAGVYVLDGSFCDLRDGTFSSNAIYAIYCDGRGSVMWWMWRDLAVRDQFFRINGLIAVAGNTTLVNVSIAFNISTEAMPSGIGVGGTLSLLDGDGDRYTTQDASVVEAITGQTGQRPPVRINVVDGFDWTRVTARNSVFLGVEVRTEGGTTVDLSACEFQEVATAVSIESDHSSRRSSVRDCAFAGVGTGVYSVAPVDLTGCSFSRCGIGVHLDLSTGVAVSNSSFITCDTGVLLDSDLGTTLGELRFLDCNWSVAAVNSADLLLTGVQVRSSHMDGVSLEDARASMTSTTIQGSGWSGVNASRCVLQMTDCDVSGSAVAALTAVSGDVQMLRCAITSASSTGIWCAYGRVQVNDSYVNAGEGLAVLAREGADVGLYNTTFSDGLMSCTDTAVVAVWWELSVRVVVAGDRAPPAPMSVVVRTQGGAVALEAETDTAGHTPWTWARQVLVRAAGTTTFTPYSVEATLLGKAFSSSFGLRSRTLHTLDIPVLVVANMTHSEPLVEGQEAWLDGSGSAGFPYDIVSWEWDLDYRQDFTSDLTGARVTVTFPADGALSIALRVTSSEGHVDVLVLDVEVGDTGPAIVPLGAWPASADEDEVVALEVRYESPVDEVILIEWDFGDGERAQGATVAHSWEQAGAYIVHLSVLDEDGSTATEEFVVAVRNVAPVAVAPASALQARKGAPVLLDGSASHDTPSDNGTLLHVWDLGGGQRLLGAMVYHTFARAGEYRVTLTVSDLDGEASSAAMVVVVSNAPPVFGALPPVTLRAGGGEQRVSLAGLLSDADDALGNLTVTAEVPEDGPLRGVKVAYDPLTGWSLTVTMEGRKDGPTSILLTAVDVDGGRATAEVNVTVEGASPIDLPGSWLPALLLVAGAAGALVAVLAVRARRRRPSG